MIFDANHTSASLGSIGSSMKSKVRITATWATSPGTLYEGCSRVPSQNTSMTRWPTEVAQDHENDSVWSSTSLNQVNLETSSYSSFSWRCGFKHSWLPKNLCLGLRSNLMSIQFPQSLTVILSRSASDLVNQTAVEWWWSHAVLPSKLTNIAGWKIHHFDGMKTRKDGDFHGRAVSFREGNNRDFHPIFEPVQDICSSTVWRRITWRTYQSEQLEKSCCIALGKPRLANQSKWLDVSNAKSNCIPFRYTGWLNLNAMMDYDNTYWTQTR